MRAIVDPAGKGLDMPRSYMYHAVPPGSVLRPRLRHFRLLTVPRLRSEPTPIQRQVNLERRWLAANMFAPLVPLPTRNGDWGDGID